MNYSSNQLRQRNMTIRISESEKAAIAERAAAMGMNPGPYMIAAALGELADDPSTVAKSLDSLSTRLERLEAAAFNF